MRSVGDVLRDARIRRAAAWTPHGVNASSLLDVTAGRYECGLRCAPVIAYDDDPIGNVLMYQEYSGAKLYVIETPIANGYGFRESSFMPDRSDRFRILEKGIEPAEESDIGTVQVGTAILLSSLPKTITRRSFVNNLNTILQSSQYRVQGTKSLAFRIIGSKLALILLDAFGNETVNDTDSIVGIYCVRASDEEPRLASVLGIVAPNTSTPKASGFYILMNESRYTASWDLPDDPYSSFISDSALAAFQNYQMYSIEFSPGTYEYDDSVTLVDSITLLPLTMSAFISEGLMGLGPTGMQRRPFSLAGLLPAFDVTRKNVLDALNSILATSDYLINTTARLELSLLMDGELNLRCRDVATGNYIGNPSSKIQGIYFGDDSLLPSALGLVETETAASSAAITLNPMQRINSWYYPIPTR